MPIFTTDTFKTEDSMKIYNKKDLLCAYWVQSHQTECHLLMEDRKLFMQTDVKSWKKQYKIKELQIFKFNNCENKCKLNNRTFYGMTLQWLKKDGDTAIINDPFSALVMGRVVNGITYWFTIKKNRDLIYEYITK
tara:strand:- start:1304 stop:1708 length:405 start_codon:yes stop_codon:yes gene_type:complete